MEIRYDKAHRRLQFFTGSTPASTRQLEEQETKIQDQGKEIAKLQNLIVDDIISLQEDSGTAYAGNSYKTYAKAVNAIDKKYRGRANWGVLQTGAIVDTRAAFIIGQGVKFTVDDPKATNEKEWLEDFVDFNDLENEVPQEFAKEAEIEGKFLGKLFMDPKRKQASVRFISWANSSYTVVTNPEDYMDYQRVWWRTPAGGTKNLRSPQFVYKRFGGRIDIPNETPPKIAKCLTQIDFLDKAIRDWREIDRMYAAPTPHVETKDAESAKKMQDAFTALNWKIKKFFAHTGKFEYLQIDAAAISALEKEIITLAKMISGTTGVPVHFLGLPDLMSNRSTAENLMELITASTTKERQIWIGGWKEIIDKSAAMWSASTKKTEIDTSKIKVEIPFITEAQWAKVKDIFIPMNLMDKLSDAGLYAQIPGFDATEEAERLAKQQEGIIKKVLNTPPVDEPDEDEGDEE